MIIIKNKNLNLYNKLKSGNYKRKQITMPNEENSRKKHIEDPINAINNNKPFNVDINKDKHNNIWQGFIDNKEKSIIITVHNGNQTV